MSLAVHIAPLQEMRASAALPGAGAWDIDTEVFTRGAFHALVTITYTDASQGAGELDFVIDVSAYTIAGNVPAGAGEWAQAQIKALGAVPFPADAAAVAESYVGREMVTYRPVVAATAETFAYMIDLGGVVERLRIWVREGGAVGNPGTCQVQVLLR